MAAENDDPADALARKLAADGYLEGEDAGAYGRAVVEAATGLRPWEHYLEAERLLACAIVSDNAGEDWWRRAMLARVAIAEAHVHALLATVDPSNAPLPRR